MKLRYDDDDDDDDDCCHYRQEAIYYKIEGVPELFSYEVAVW